MVRESSGVRALIPPPPECDSNCCGETCDIFADDFTTNQLATEYSQRSGSWSVGSGKLSTTSSSALLRCETAAGGGAGGAVVSCTAKFASTSDSAKLILGYVDDNNYWYFEFKITGGNSDLSIYERSGGTDTLRANNGMGGGGSTGVDHSLCFSIGQGVVIGTLGSAIAVAYGASPTIASTKAGVGTGSSSSSVTFDNFSFKRHRVDLVTCDTCKGCGGCSGIVPNLVQVDIAGNAAGFNGTYICGRFHLGATPADCAWHFDNNALSFCPSPTTYAGTVQCVGALSRLDFSIVSAGSGGVCALNNWRLANYLATGHGDCDAWSSLSIPPNIASGTCLLSAL